MSERFKRLKHSEQTVNTETGEVVTVSKTYTVKTTVEEFFMVFISHMSGFFKITSLTDIKALAFLCQKADFSTGHVSLTSAKRKEMMDQLSITNRQTVSHALDRLKKLGLISGDHGEYDINPYVFWKGSTRDRDQYLKKHRQELKIKFEPQ